MAREFAKKFYNSKAWQKCRDLVFERDFGLCVKCGAPGEEVHHITWLRPENINDPNITLNASNLITLCKDCHKKEHSRNQYLQKKSIREGLMFDENGNILQIYPPR